MDSDMEIIWSAKAKKTFFHVINYLSSNWTTKEIIQYNQKIYLLTFFDSRQDLLKLIPMKVGTKSRKWERVNANFIPFLSSSNSSHDLSDILHHEKAEVRKLLYYQQL